MAEKYVRMIRKMQSDRRVLAMAGFRQHGGMSTYDHCRNVAVVAARVASRLHLREYKIANIIVGGMLHDFYLYDYHESRRTPKGLHAFAHPKIALENARRSFRLNERQEDIIKSHMFPATPFCMPRYVESWIVSMADKYCAARELIARRKGWHAA